MENWGRESHRASFSKERVFPEGVFHIFSLIFFPFLTNESDFLKINEFSEKEVNSIIHKNNLFEIFRGFS